MTWFDYFLAMAVWLGAVSAVAWLAAKIVNMTDPPERGDQRGR